jgi:hypothetical protein
VTILAGLAKFEQQHGRRAAQANYRAVFVLDPVCVAAATRPGR